MGDTDDVTLRPRRSVLYMPGANERALEKAKGIPADALILDLEDAVAPDAKAEARDRVCTAAASGAYGRKEVAIRVNGLTTQWHADDLAAAAKAYDAEAVLKNPRGGKSDYKYVKPPLGNQSPAERIVIYETDALDPNGLDVGFADGHVEFMAKEQFDKQLKAQEEKDKAAPAAK